MYKVEKVFDYKNLTCVVVFTDLGFRDGYVAIPAGTKAYKYGSEDSVICSSCHGDITYTGDNNGYPIKLDKDVIWYGFDCGHYGDSIDYDAACKYFPQFKKMYDNQKDMSTKINSMYGRDDNEVRSMDYVIEQCKVLADDILEYENDKELE